MLCYICIWIGSHRCYCSCILSCILEEKSLCICQCTSPYLYSTKWVSSLGKTSVPTVKAAGSELFYENDVLKNFAIFMEKHLCEIFKNSYFEEHLHTASSELTSWRDCLELCLCIPFKPYWLSNITKIPVALK